MKGVAARERDKIGPSRAGRRCYRVPFREPRALLAFWHGSRLRRRRLSRRHSSLRGLRLSVTPRTWHALWSGLDNYDRSRRGIGCPSGSRRGGGRGALAVASWQFDRTTQLAQADRACVPRTEFRRVSRRATDGLESQPRRARRPYSDSPGGPPNHPVLEEEVADQNENARNCTPSDGKPHPRLHHPAVVRRVRAGRSGRGGRGPRRGWGHRRLRRGRRRPDRPAYLPAAAHDVQIRHPLDETILRHHVVRAEVLCPAIPGTVDGDGIVPTAARELHGNRRHARDAAGLEIAVTTRPAGAGRAAAAVRQNARPTHNHCGGVHQEKRKEDYTTSSS
eukprot:scaffold9956_cov114-Isochrysis_galbana.AAC.3